jgi:hypothetical protein
MKFLRVGAELLDTCGQTDRQIDITKLIGAFRQDANHSKHQSVPPVTGNSRCFLSEPCRSHKDFQWAQLEIQNVKADDTRVSQ